MATELTERPVQLKGSAIARALLRLVGWQLQFDGLPARQGLLLVYPHTSNWDFVFGILAKWGTGMPAAFWGKESLFRAPLLGPWMRWLGGRPVGRHTPGGAVGQMLLDMREAARDGRFLWLALAPEGTRQGGKGWRTGFYRIAEGASVPVALVRLDYARRVVGVDSCWRLSGDMQADFGDFALRLSDATGRRPLAASPVVPIGRDEWMDNDRKR